MLQGRMSAADAVMKGAQGGADMQTMAAASLSTGATTESGKRKGSAGKPGAKKAAKKGPVQGRKGAAMFQFDVFGSKL